MAAEESAAIALRPLEPEDATAAADVIHRSTSAAYTFMPWTHSQQETRGWFAAGLQDWSQVWLAERAGRVVGVLCLQDHHIDQLFVDTNVQQRGIGSRLLAKALSLCHGPVTLHTFQNNLVARAFYEKRGFKAVEFGVSDAEGEPDVLYRFDPADGSATPAC